MKIEHEALGRIAKYLKETQLELSKNLKDKRLNSSTNENEIALCIKNFTIADPWFKIHNLEVLTPNLENDNNREWYDVLIQNKGNKKIIYMPINIKVTDIANGSADNLSCKLGIFYALTGKIPTNLGKNSITNSVSWEKYFKILHKYIGKIQNKDYYFLVVNKKDTSDIFWNSLKSLKTLTPNGNNLPFQCKWCDNRDKQERTFNEAKKFILSTLYSSIKLREKIGESFRNEMSSYL